MLCALLVAATFAVVGRAQPPAIVLETRIPHIIGVQPSCSPAITSTGLAFACYKTMSTYFVAAMGSGGTTVLLNNASAPYTKTPKLTGDIALIYESLNAGSFYSIVTSSRCVEYYDRHGITAGVGLIGNSVAVPLGSGAREGYEDFVQFLTIDNNGLTTLVSNVQQNNTDPTGTAIVGPVVWNNKFVMMVGNVLHLLSTTGQILRISNPNPCGVTFQSLQGIVAINYNVQGSARSMLILYGNTTVTQETFHFCSIDPFTFNLNWNLPYNDVLDVDNVIGSAGVILVSATVISARVIVTFSIDAAAGKHLLTLTRQVVDLFSWPAFLPTTIDGCAGTFVMQSGGQATAFCTDTFAAIWTAPYRCSHQPAIDGPRFRLVCTDWGAAVTMLDFVGTVIWHDTRVQAEYQPTLANGKVYVMDGNAAMWVLSYLPGSDNPTSPVSGGLTGGEVFLIILGIVVIAGSIIGATVYYKRAARRTTKPMRIDAEGYGSLTT